MATTGDRYVEPGWFTRHVFNGLVAAATRVGLSVWGSRVLEVRGRTSGEWRSTPVWSGVGKVIAPRSWPPGVPEHASGVAVGLTGVTDGPQLPGSCTAPIGSDLTPSPQARKAVACA